MKVLITGANGLLGGNLIRELVQQSFDVRAMVRAESNLLTLEGVDQELVKGNFYDSIDFFRAAEGCDVVVHAAANANQSPTGYEHYKRTNVEATQMLLMESVKAGVKRFIYVGSANAFAPGSKERPGDENSTFTPIQYKSGYMRSKFEAQKLVLEFEKEHDIEVIVVNPTFMLGKYDGKPSSGQLLLRAHGKNIMACPPGGKNFIHAKDVAVGIVQAIRKGISGNCYLMGNENLSYDEFFRKMRQVSGYPKRMIKLPGTLISSVGYGGDFFENITGKPTKLNSINARLLCADNYYSSGKAINELQLPQTPIETAIEDALDWFGKFGYLG